MSSTGFPAVLCVAAGDTDLTIRSFTDTVGDQRITVLSNLSEPYSPITGNRMEQVKSDDHTEVASSLDSIADRFPVVASCTSCNHDTLVAGEVAAELDGEEISCSNCGEKIEVAYYGDLLSASEDDDSDEDESDDDTSDEDDSDDLTGDDDSDDDSSDEDSSDDDTSDDDSDDDTSDEDDSDDEDESDDEDDSDEDSSDDDSDIVDAIDESSTDDADADSDVEKDPVAVDADAVDESIASPVEVSVTVATASLADADEDVRLIACDTELSRIEVFKGDSHIGRMLKVEATDSVRQLFAKPNQLHVAFARVLSGAWGEFASDEAPEALKDFGFKPATVEVKLDDVAATAVATVAAEAEAKGSEEVDAKIAEAETAFVKSLNIAMAGLNKGVLEGPNFLAEVAKTLKRHGIARPLEVAQRVIEQASEPFLAKALEHAANLRKEGADYTRGMSRSVERASFQLPTDPSEDPSIATAAVLSGFSDAPNRATQPQKSAVIVEAASTTLRARNAFSGIGRR